jgi:hypothetical protein
VIGLWRREFWLCRKLVVVYPGHEALWFHRRFVMDHWIKYLLPHSPALTATFYDHHHHQHQENGDGDEEEEEIGFRPDERGEDEEVVLSREARFIERCCTDDTQERFEAQREAGRAYLAWLLRFVLPHDRRLVVAGHEEGASALSLHPMLGPRRRPAPHS